MFQNRAVIIFSFIYYRRLQWYPMASRKMNTNIKVNFAQHFDKNTREHNCLTPTCLNYAVHGYVISAKGNI